MRARAVLGLALALVVAAGCSGPRATTEMIITVDADDVVRGRADDVVVEVFGRGASDTMYPPEPTHLGTYEVPVDGARWGPVVVLFPEGRDAQRIYRVTARAREGMTPFVEARLISGYVEGATLHFQLYLRASCIDAVCGDDQTCGDMGCVGAFVDPRTLLEGGTSMDAGRDAARGDAEPDAGMDARVGDDDADVDADVDAGLDAAMDAPSDASVEAGPTCGDCDDGVDCTLDRCEGTTCVHDVMCDDGVDCTVDGCDGAGACTHMAMNALCPTGSDCERVSCDAVMGCIYTGDDRLCDDSQPCTDDVCGATGCTFPPLAAGTSCADTTFCNGVETCNGSGACSAATNPCPGASMCNEAMDRCTGCVGDSDCPVDSTVYGSCDYADSCDEMAERPRTTTTYTCVGGSCDDSVSSVMEACTRDTDTIACPGDSCSAFTCGGFTSVCDSIGVQQRTCTVMTCMMGTCGGTSRMETGDPCARVTEGTSCGGPSCGADYCPYSGPCEEDALAMRDCTQRRCRTDACTPEVYSEPGSISCVRDTDGFACGPCGACTAGTCSMLACDSGTDTGLGDAGGVVTTDGGGSLGMPQLMLNEIDYDQPGTADGAEFIELYNAGPGPASLDGLAVVLVNGTGGGAGVEYGRATLTGSLAPGAYALVTPDGSLVTGTPRFSLGLTMIQNGSPDGVLIWDIMGRRVVDALSYGGSITSATISAPGAASGVDLVEPPATFSADSGIGDTSVCRLPNGSDTDQASLDWSPCSGTTPGGPNL